MRRRKYESPFVCHSCCPLSNSSLFPSLPPSLLTQDLGVGQGLQPLTEAERVEEATAVLVLARQRGGVWRREGGREGGREGEMSASH